MSIRLQQIRYGKARVRLVKVTRLATRHDLSELTVHVKLEGGFEQSYLTGDNSRVIATDTMKNVVYALASRHPVDPIESFAAELGRHFLDNYAHVGGARIEIAERRWNRLDPHTFEQGGELRLARVDVGRPGVTIRAGIGNLVLLKTTKSSFEGYIRDRYTTLKETADRILATSVRALWRYAGVGIDFNACMRASREILVSTFAAHHSRSVQETLYAMGSAVLAARPEIAEIRLVLPNKHCLPVDLTPFGLENRNEIFMPVDEPHGLIEAVLGRDTRTL